MATKRNRSRPLLSLQERLAQFTEQARAAARKTPIGAERHQLLEKARNGEAAGRMERWLSSPGLQSPK